MRYIGFNYQAFVAFLIILTGIHFISVAQDDNDQKNSPVQVYKFDIKKEIAPPVWHSTKKALEEAVAQNADVILIEMSTYGGMLESADSIRTKILNSPIPVICFIHHNAASAGALIAIACDSIYMSTGSSIGAATVVDQAGQVVPDKYQSYMRAMMRATAEATGRDPNIAQAMVDPRIEIEGVIDSGSVLTFTASEAMKFGYCNGIAETVDEVIGKAGIKDYEIIEQKLTAIDKIIGFLISPVISGILIMVIVGGIYFELQTPGIGFPSIAAVTAALLYFAPLYLEGLAAHWEILIFIVGIILVAIEIFAIPGFGIAGISGIVLIITGLTLSMIGNIGLDFRPVNFNNFIVSFFIVIISIFLSIIGSYFLTKSMFSRNRIFGSLALETVESAEEGYTTSDSSYREMVGKTGTAHSILRPVGKVNIGGEIYDATALTGYIDKGEKIEVIRYETTQLFVRKIEN
ncbi:MAG TPA: NfeD family protein [Bacteroidales bacterium]|nr:NfeD family protein [Bacteroidales bacterium]HOX77999.1 NfeD family protein [Bacteroidales bacterium]HPI85492.1 NfeD family protein [Bacteroidales bacterium]HPM91690.1 NfeD family protein [Bacteroidales bacterium]